MNIGVIISMKRIVEYEYFVENEYIHNLNQCTRIKVSITIFMHLICLWEKAAMIATHIS